MFTAVAATQKVRHFINCSAAFDWIQKIGTPDLYDFNIFLNRSDGTAIQLSVEDATALDDFEQNAKLFATFEETAEESEAMTYPQQLETALSLSMDLNKAEEEQIVLRKIQVSELQEENEGLYRELNELVFERNMLKNKLEKSIKTQRENAMAWISSMDFVEFEKRLLSKNKLLRLPEFLRAKPGDEDYEDPSIPDRQTCICIKRSPLTSSDIDKNSDNYASIYRWKLRNMSEDDFREMAYESPEEMFDPVPKPVNLKKLYDKCVKEASLNLHYDFEEEF